MAHLTLIEDIKTALIALLAADAAYSDTAVSYREPRRPSETKSSAGTRELVYFVPDAGGSFDITVFRSSSVAYNINGTLTLRVEVTDNESDADRAVLEDRAAVLADVAITECSDDPTLGLGGTWANLEVHPVSWELVAAPVDQGYGAAIDVVLEFRHEPC